MAKSCVSHPPPLPYATLKSPLHHLKHHQSQHLKRNNNNNNNLVQFKYPTLPFPSSSSSSSFPRPHHQNLIFLLNVSASASPQYYKLFAFPRRRPNFAVNALDSNDPNSYHEGSVNVGRSVSHTQWDSLTAKFSGAANIPFLLLQMPQIILNGRNLMAGNKTALMAVPWLGMLTSLLGNLSLLSYFAKKREKEAMVVQTLGVVSTFVVIAQLALAEAMPLPYFLVTSVAVVSGLFLNFMNYFGLLDSGIWLFWEDFITIGGLSVLPQIMWSTFVPYIPNSILPGATAFVIAVLAVTMARSGKLSEKGVKFVGGISGWTATLLFMWMPVSQMWTNYLNPENMKGLSAFSMLLAMIGNGLLIPRALFIRDFMWFTGSVWATLFYGYGNIACLHFLNIISKEFFLAATVGLVSWIGYPLAPNDNMLTELYMNVFVAMSGMCWVMLLMSSYVDEWLSGETQWCMVTVHLWLPFVTWFLDHEAKTCDAALKFKLFSQL